MIFDLEEMEHENSESTTKQFVSAATRGTSFKNCKIVLI